MSNTTLFEESFSQEGFLLVVSYIKSKPHVLLIFLPGNIHQLKVLTRGCKYVSTQTCFFFHLISFYATSFYCNWKARLNYSYCEVGDAGWKK